MNKKICIFTLLTVIVLTISACTGGTPTDKELAPPPPKANAEEKTPTSTSTETPTPTSTATFTPTPQSTQASASSGPNIEDFPAGFNPLTGQLVGDPNLLNLPAILISITNFPPSARPQAGLSFAPMIFEIYISEGMTRFLVAFYGEEPKTEERITGNCAVQEEPFEAAGIVLGNLVWLDANSNGIQDPGEAGVGGVCVTLYDTAGNILQTTSTDSNGYYGFNVSPGDYVIGYDETALLAFTTLDVGFDDLDSDADPLTGMTPNITVPVTDMNWDAGLVRKPPTPTPTGTYESPTPKQPGGGGGDMGGGTSVGPIRSMRWPYVYIRNFFTGSCLVSASGDPTVLAHAPGCTYAYGSDEDDINSAFLDVTKMRQLRRDSKRQESQPGTELFRERFLGAAAFRWYDRARTKSILQLPQPDALEV